MKNYSASNTEEKESYDEFRRRKESDWNERVRNICIEVRDSSLKDEDKKDFIVELATKLLNNNLNHKNWI